MNLKALEEIRAAAQEWLERAKREGKGSEVKHATRALTDINKVIHHLTEKEL